MKIIPKWFAVVMLMCASIFPIQMVWAGESNDTAVLLPVTGPLTSYEKMEMAGEIVAGLSGRLKLIHGNDVDLFVSQVFREESQKQDCDEVNCYRRIAEHYQAEKIVALRVATLDKDRYLLTFYHYDVFEGKMTASQQKECAQCSLDKLKELCRAFTAHL